MSKNYLFILIIIGYIIFSSCKDRNYTNIRNYRVINQTDNSLFCEITNVTWDSTETKYSFVKSNDSVNFLFSYAGSASQLITISYYSSCISFNIYNLNDTTKISKPYSSDFIDNDWIFYNNEDKLEYYINLNSTNGGELGSYRLFIDVDKLSLFEKDYSMLEKFPEYYGN